MRTSSGWKLPGIFGLEIEILPSALVMTFALLVAFAGLRMIRGDSLLQAAGFGFGVALVHTLSLFWHHFGHAAAARLCGYPMSGIVVQHLIWRSAYPGDEPALPARLHAVRALGGPAASLVLAILVAAAWLSMEDAADWLRRLTLVAMLDNGLVFTAGSLLPLGFTDGSTLYRLWRWGRPER